MSINPMFSIEFKDEALAGDVCMALREEIDWEAIGEQKVYE